MNTMHYTPAVLSGGWFIMCNTAIDQSPANLLMYKLPVTATRSAHESEVLQSLFKIYRLLQIFIFPKKY